MVVFHPSIFVFSVGSDHAFPCRWPDDLVWAVSFWLEVGGGSFRLDKHAVPAGEVSAVACDGFYVIEVFQQYAQLCGVADLAGGDLHAGYSLVEDTDGCVKLEVLPF